MSQLYRFGSFSLDVPARELRRDDDLLNVSPKVFDCIVYLIENRERAVGRDELVAAVWGRADVAEAQLGHLIRKLRRTLGDNGEDQSIVHTIPRFGFRWVAALQTEPADRPPPERTRGEVERSLGQTVDPALASPLPPKTQRSARTGRQRAGILSGTAIVAALLIVAVAQGFWTTKSHPQKIGIGQAAESRSPSISTLTPISAPSLAVLPVAGDVGGDAQWMRLGLMDLIAGILREAELTVAPSANVVSLLDQHGNPKDRLDHAFAATGAERIVSPTIARAGEGWTVRLEVQGAGGTRIVEASAPDPIIAARGATDRLLDILGAALPRQPRMPPSVAEVLQRADAALLVDDFDGARRLIENAPAEVKALPEAQLLLGRAEVGSDQAEPARARFKGLLRSLSTRDDAVLRAQVLIALGVAELNRAETAVQHFTDAIGLLEGFAEPDHLGNAYSGRGVAWGVLGRYEDASTDYARARVAFSLAGDAIGLARIDNNEAAMASRRGRPADALPLLIRTAERFERIGALDKLVSVLVNEISAYLDLLQPADALAVFRQNAGRFDGVGNGTDRHIWRLQGTVALVANGKLRESSELLDGVTRELGPDNAAILRLWAQVVRAEIAFASGRVEAAATPAKQAIDGIGPHRLEDERARSWLMLLRAQHALHREADAGPELQHFTDWSRHADSRVAVWYQAVAEAEEHVRAGRRAAGWALYEETLRSVKENGTPADLATVAVSYGNALIDSGELVGASTVLGSIGRWTERDYDCAMLQLRLYRALGRKNAWQSALVNVRALAGERPVPAEFEAPPEQELALTRP